MNSGVTLLIARHQRIGGAPGLPYESTHHMVMPSGMKRRRKKSDKSDLEEAAATACDEREQGGEVVEEDDIFDDVEWMTAKSSRRKKQKSAAKGLYTHGEAARQKISMANKGNTPWNKGKNRSGADKAKISAGVRARNKAVLLKKLDEIGMTEDEWIAKKKKIKHVREKLRKLKDANNKKEQGTKGLNQQTFEEEQDEKDRRDEEEGAEVEPLEDAEMVLRLLSVYVAMVRLGLLNVSFFTRSLGKTNGQAKETGRTAKDASPRLSERLFIRRPPNGGGEYMLLGDLPNRWSRRTHLLRCMHCQLLQVPVGDAR